MMGCLYSGVGSRESGMWPLDRSRDRGPGIPVLRVALWYYGGIAVVPMGNMVWCGMLWCGYGMHHGMGMVRYGWEWYNGIVVGVKGYCSLTASQQMTNGSEAGMRDIA